MTAVLATPPFLQFFDADGDPLAGGKIYTYAAGTTTPKATYTDESASIEMANPIILDDAGKSTWWLVGSYKYIVKDSLDNTIATTDNVTSFSTLATSNDAFFESFSGDGSTTAFVLSQDLGTDEKGLMVFVNKGLQQYVTNGSFATDTGWTKGAGWTIAAGVATATGAISTAISQTAAFTLVQGQVYSVTYTITRSAGGLIPSVGGTSGVERTASGTYNEVIVAGSSQTLAFTGNGFTGTLDNVSINLAAPATYAIQNPSAYTVNGTSLTFASAPPTGTNNIYVFAPSLLLGAASAAAAAAAADAASAAASADSAASSANSALAYQAKNKWTYSSTTTMTDPGTGGIRLNNAAFGSVTAIAISDLSADAGNPDLSTWINTWDDASGSNRGTVYIFKDNANFALYALAADNVDNTTWNELTVTYLTSTGSFTDTDSLNIGFTANGTSTVIGGITALTGEVTASGSGSVAATISNDAVTLAKMQNAVANSKLVGSGASGAGADYVEITLGTGLSMSGTTLNNTATSPFSDSFTSSEIAVVSGSNAYTAVAHGLGAVPSLVQISLRNKTAEAGYSVNDEFICMGVVSGVGEMNVTANATNITILQLSNAAVLNKTTAAASGITTANWKYVIRAWI